MAITFPLSFPTVSAPYKITYRDVSVVGVSEAPMSLIQQVQEFQGSRWECDLSFRPMQESVGREMVNFFRKLRGRAGTFLFIDPRYEGPYGAASATPGAPQVDGAGQTGLTLSIKTGLGVVANYLKAGDFLSYGTGATRRLHVVTSDATLDGVGKATLDIWPRLRDSPVDLATIDLTTPTGRFRLNTNSIEYDEDEVGNFTLATMPIIEDLA